MPKFTPSKRTANLPYRNSSLCVEARVYDLLSRTTFEEKAGQMFQTILLSGPNGTLEQATPEMNSSDYMITTQLMTHFNLAIQIEDPKAAAEFTNRVHARALETRLGIPVTLSTDPRHAFTDDIRTGFQAGGFSQWPETFGLVAIQSAALVRRFAEIVREEYLAVGIRAALHPQVDLATEPRWPRNRDGFGENATLTAELLTAYIKGFEGDNFRHQSVSTVTKHFPGAGSTMDGHDAHNRFGINSTYPGHNFDYHLIPFKVAIEAGARQMMPYYSRPVGTEYDAVGFSFNKAIVTGLVREKLGFHGVVLTDWGLITNAVVERAAKIINAGCNQFRGEARPELVVELVKTGVISESRINQSVRNLLREKFLHGLFNHPFVDPKQSKLIIGNPYFRRVGFETQRKSYTLLTNKDNILPLRGLRKKTRFYVEGFNSSLIKARGFQVTSKPSQADFTILRLKAPSAPAGPIELGIDLESGSLEYTTKEKQRQAKVFSAVPTIVDINFNRPAAVPEVAAEAKALFASYGSSTDAFLNVVFNVDGAAPEGKLPFDLPRNNAAVAESFEDVPFDTKHPVFRSGHGLSYDRMCR
ncbi:hypothetical protein ACHAO9_006446 [Fusarium lateritium]